MRKLHKQCFIAVLFASGAFATSEVSGTPLLVAQAQSIGLSIVDQDIDTRTSGTAFADLIDARTASRAVAQFGTLRALGQAVDVPPVPSHSTSAAAAASWADDVTLDAAGLMGQVGTATVQYRIDGSMSFDSAASARSNYSFFVRRGQLFDNVSVGNWEIGVGASGADFMNRTISATFPIVFGAEPPLDFYDIAAEHGLRNCPGCFGSGGYERYSPLAWHLGGSRRSGQFGVDLRRHIYIRHRLVAIGASSRSRTFGTSPLLHRRTGDFRGCVAHTQ